MARPLSHRLLSSFVVLPNCSYGGIWRNSMRATVNDCAPMRTDVHDCTLLQNRDIHFSVNGLSAFRRGSVFRLKFARSPVQPRDCPLCKTRHFPSSSTRSAARVAEYDRSNRSPATWPTIQSPFFAADAADYRGSSRPLQAPRRLGLRVSTLTDSKTRKHWNKSLSSTQYEGVEGITLAGGRE